jgi:hypothetical protein
MMAFVFFMLWMLACLGLLAVWVFRKSPDQDDERRRALASASRRASAEH